MGKDLNDIDINEYILANSIHELFYGKPWKIPLTKLIYNDDNKEPLAFVHFERGNNLDSVLTKLPTEFFNHQLLEYDYTNPEKLANFMNSFGIFDFSSIELKNHKRFVEIINNIDAFDDDQVYKFNEEFGGFYDPFLWRNSSLYEDYRQRNFMIAEKIKLINSHLKNSQKDKTILTKNRVVGFQDIWSATESYKNWIYASKRIKALSMYKTIDEISAYTGDSPHSAFRACEGAIAIVQKELDNVKPTLEIYNLTEKKLKTHNGDSYGSLSQALALQLWNFTLEAKKGLSICKECGEPFIHKQTKSKTQQSRNTHKFCCDKCKNRNAQRKYRQSEGYKLKQNKKLRSTK